MNRSASRRTSAKLLVAAVTAAAAAAVVPAQAIVGTPEVAGTTFPLGYTKTPLGVGVSYNSRIDPAGSSIVVTDVNGDPVTGTMTLDLPERTLIFNTTSTSRFNETLSPYSATFTARAVGQALTEPDSVETFTFDVDFITPFAPNVVLNDGADLITIATPSAELAISGVAADIIPDSGIVSGVAKIDIHFYNPLANPTQLTLGGIPEVARMHRTIVFDCDPACNPSETLSIDIGDLDLGYWNVKVSVTDAAGNQSAQSEPMRVLKLASPLEVSDVPEP